MSRLLSPLSWRTRRDVRQKTDFRIDNDRLNIADADVFKRDPLNLIRFFTQAERTGGLLHPDAVRLLRSSLRLVDELRRRAPPSRLSGP